MDQMKLKYILGLADHLRAIRSKLSAESWETVIGAIMQFCRESNSTFREDLFLNHLNRKDGK